MKEIKEMTYNDLYTRNRASVHPGETTIIDGVYKTCKLNCVRIDSQMYPADYSTVNGWTYYDMDTHQRKQVPDGVEIVCEWDYPSRQIPWLQNLNSSLLNAKKRLGIS